METLVHHTRASVKYHVSYEFLLFLAQTKRMMPTKLMLERQIRQIVDYVGSRSEEEHVEGLTKKFLHDLYTSVYQYVFSGHHAVTLHADDPQQYHLIAHALLIIQCADNDLSDLVSLRKEFAVFAEARKDLMSSVIGADQQEYSSWLLDELFAEKELLEI